jgi:hypothetical protein
MIHKKSVLVLMFFVLFLSFKSAVLAQDTTIKAARQTTQITRIKTQSDKAIDNRITSLNTRIAKINALKKISDSQKSDFASQFQSRITDLTNLKAKIDADTDLNTIKADYKSIFTDNRIFAIFEPKMNIMAQADNIIGRANTQLTKTTDANVQAKLNDAITQANAAIAKVSGLTPQNYPAKDILTSARSLIKLALADLNTARPLTKKK